MYQRLVRAFGVVFLLVMADKKPQLYASRLSGGARRMRADSEAHGKRSSLRLVTESGGLATNPPCDKLIEGYSTLHGGLRQGFVTEGPRQRYVTGGGWGGPRQTPILSHSHIYMYIYVYIYIYVYTALATS